MTALARNPLRSYRQVSTQTSIAQHGKDLGRLLGDLLNHFRNLLLFQVSHGDLNLLEVSEIEIAALKEQAALATADSLTRILEVLADAELRLRDAASKKILIEITLLKAIEARSAMSLDAVLKQLNAMRSGTGLQPMSSPAPASERRVPSRSEPTVPHKQAETVPVAPITTPNPSPNVGGYITIAETPAASGDLEALWSKLVDAVGRVSSFTRTYLVDAHPVSLVKGVLTIGFDPEFQDHMSLVDNARNHAMLQTKLAELGHHNAQIKFIKAEVPAGRVAAPTPVAAPAPTPTIVAPKRSETGSPATAATPSASKEKSATVPFSKDDFKNDPLIQKALEIFKGTIVEVRA